MKVIGLIGGLLGTTSLYYKHINTLTLSQYDQMQSLFYIAWTLVK